MILTHRLHTLSCQYACTTANICNEQDYVFRDHFQTDIISDIKLFGLLDTKLKNEALAFTILFILGIDIEVYSFKMNTFSFCYFSFASYHF